MSRHAVLSVLLVTAVFVAALLAQSTTTILDFH
jgi:hypothetical protein